MTGVRIDKWLWAARFFKTRSLAAKACELGRVESAGQRLKAAREVHPGDKLRTTNDTGDFDIEVLQLSAVRGPASVAQTLYHETEASREARLKAAAERKALPGAPGSPFFWANPGASPHATPEVFRPGRAGIPKPSVSTLGTPCAQPSGGAHTKIAFPISGKFGYLRKVACLKIPSPRALRRLASNGKNDRPSGRRSAARMKVRTCHHILDNGKLCQAVALRGHNHCYHHFETTKRQMRMAWARARVALRVAEERQTPVRIPLVKRGPKSVPALPVSLMESIG